MFQYQELDRFPKYFVSLWKMTVVRTSNMIPWQIMIMTSFFPCHHLCAYRSAFYVTLVDFEFSDGIEITNSLSIMCGRKLDSETPLRNQASDSVGFGFTSFYGYCMDLYDLVKMYRYRILQNEICHSAWKKPVTPKSWPALTRAFSVQVTCLVGNCPGFVANRVAWWRILMKIFPQDS